MACSAVSSIRSLSPPSSAPRQPRRRTASSAEFSCRLPKDFKKYYDSIPLHRVRFRRGSAEQCGRALVEGIRPLRYNIEGSPRYPAGVAELADARTQNHPYKLFCLAKPPFFSVIAKQLTPLYTTQALHSWAVFEARPLMPENTRSSAVKSRLQARQQQSLAVFDLPRRQEPKGFNQGRRLAKAKDFAEDWYLGLRGKSER